MYKQCIYIKYAKLYLMPTFEFPSRCLRDDSLLTTYCYLCIKIHIASFCKQLIPITKIRVLE